MHHNGTTCPLATIASDGFIPPSTEDQVDTLENLLDFYGLGLWSLARIDGYQVTVHVDGRFDRSRVSATIDPNLFVIRRTAATLSEAVFQAFVGVLEAAPSFETLAPEGSTYSAARVSA